MSGKTDPIYEAREHRYGAWAESRGVVRASAAPCPCRLLRRRQCRDCGSFPHGANPPNFGWRRLLSGRWLDHQRLWRRERQLVLFTSEPYNLNPADVGELAAGLGAHGLHLEVSDDPSPWYPGSTVLLLVTRQDGAGAPL